MKITIDWGNNVVRTYQTKGEPVPESDVVVIKTVHPAQGEHIDIEFQRNMNK